MNRDQVVQQIWQDLAPVLEEQGYELIEVEFPRSGGTDILRLFIDSDKGITLDDCQAANGIVNPVLDSLDCIEGAYVLEVSSPGIDRPVRREKDFARYEGEDVAIKTNVPVEGRSRFKGKLGPLKDGMVTVECDGDQYPIHLHNIKKAKLAR